jgi:hypothetical protein
MKPTSSFKFPKYYKARMASIVDKEQRNSYKRAMISALLYAQEQERRLGKSDKSNNYNDE